MKIQKFEDIVAWQKSQELAVELYNIFKTCKDYEFKNQICRAGVSISNNIAEGFDRSSNIEFKRFLYISLASCSEVRSMLYIGDKISLISKNNKEDLINKTSEISKIIRGLIKSLKLEIKK